MSRLRAVVIAGLTALLALVTIFLTLQVGTDGTGFSLPALLLAAVGVFLMIRVPHNRVGMILALGGVAWLLYISAGDYARLSLQSEAGPFPGEYLAGWIGSWIGALLPVSLTALLLVFPDGQPPRGWRWLATVLVLVVALAVVGAVLLWGFPLAVLTDFDRLDLEPRYLWVDLAFIGGFASVLPATASLVTRYRRGDLIERQQIKWLLGAAVVFASVFVLGNVFLDSGPVWEWLVSASMALIPIAVAIAVVRYRLYDIERIISRTVSYALVVGLLGLVVVGLIAGLAIFLPSDDPLVVAVATLVVFALFNPLRLRVQRVVDRRFNRSRYDAERVVEGFAYSLRERVDPERVVDGWISTVTQTMEPAEIAVWIRE
jgi:hypothetical protein